MDKLYDTFKKHNKELYLVGGAVRDILLGLEPNDFDFSTNALPTEVMSMFKHVEPTGIAYGTVTVLLEDEAYEITTFRKDHDYDGRRPKAVTFSKTLKEDLKRRDFTINAMAKDREGKIYDYFGGRSDLESGIVRFVGDPYKRVVEDKLRLIRGIRFATCYDFIIPEDEYAEIYLNALEFNLERISVERFTKEFNKILLSQNVRKGLNLLKDTKMLELFIPEIKDTYNFDQKNIHHTEDIFNHTLTVVENTDQKLKVRLAALFHDIGKPSTFTFDGQGHFYGHEKKSTLMTKEILKRLKYPNKIIDDVLILIREHMFKEKRPSDKSLRKLIKRVNTRENLLNLINLLKADTNRKEDLSFLETRSQVILDSKPAVTIKDLEVNGFDIMKTFNLKPGKEIGELLNYLLCEVIENPKLNDKEELLNLIKSRKKEI